MWQWFKSWNLWKFPKWQLIFRIPIIICGLTIGWGVWLWPAIPPLYRHDLWGHGRTAVFWIGEQLEWTSRNEKFWAEIFAERKAACIKEAKSHYYLLSAAEKKRLGIKK